MMPRSVVIAIRFTAEQAKEWLRAWSFQPCLFFAASGG
jgi:hypothetical protein